MSEELQGQTTHCPVCDRETIGGGLCMVCETAQEDSAE